jgi:hypothetical protein
MALFVSKMILVVDMKCDAQFYTSRGTTGETVFSSCIVIIATFECFGSGRPLTLWLSVRTATNNFPASVLEIRQPGTLFDCRLNIIFASATQIPFPMV